MIDIFKKLCTVKSIVTAVLTVTFAVLAGRGDIMPKSFMTVYTAVIGFYFGTQHEKKEKMKQSD